MQTDYKISRITRFDDGRVEVIYQVYEGDVTTELERQINGTMAPVTRYRRFRALGPPATITMPDLPLRALDAQIRRICNDRLALDLTRTPIAEQRNA